MEKFKVGDWVQFSWGKPFILTEKDYKYFKDCNTLYLWQPKQDEWCWFWDAGNQPVLSRYKGYIKLTGYMCDGDWYQKNITGFQFCEPFTGKLPSFLKDAK